MPKQLQQHSESNLIGGLRSAQAWQTSEDTVFNFMWIISGHLDHPAKGQAVIFLTGWLAVFIYEISILATVSDTSVRYQAVNIQSFSENMIQWDFLTSCNKILKNHIFRQTWWGLSLASIMATGGTNSSWLRVGQEAQQKIAVYLVIVCILQTLCASFKGPIFQKYEGKMKYEWHTRTRYGLKITLAQRFECRWAGALL